MSTDQLQEQQASGETSSPANIVAWAGVIFAAIAAVLYGVLFFMLSELPSTPNELEELKTNAPALTRLLIVGGSAGLLNVVSLILCLTGYIIPRGSGLVAVIGSIASLLMMLAVFSIVIASLIVVS